MRHVSAKFLAAIQLSHQLATRAVVMINGVDSQEIAIVDGTVTLDATAAVRGRCDVTIVDDGTLGLVPDTPAALLAPYGNEIRLERGIAFPDGTEELVGLGVFRLDETTVTDQADSSEIHIAAFDRSQRIIDARFEAPYQVDAGTNVVAAITAVLQDAWPTIPTAFTPTGSTTPLLIAQEGEDRWAFAQQLAQSIGMDLYFDGDGVCRLTPSTVVGDSVPVATISEGDDGVLLSVARTWSRQGSYNRLVVTGENTGETAPARGVATDDNPLSPTYYFGPFGKVPKFYVSSFITTDEQAENAAIAMLSRELGTTQGVQFGSIVLPHLEPYDIVRITRERIGVDEDHILDQVTIPLSAQGTMSAVTRAQVVT